MLGHRGGLPRAFGCDWFHEPSEGSGGCEGSWLDDGRFVQSLDQLAAQLVEQAFRDHRFAGDCRFQAAKLVDRAAQSGELGLEQAEVGGPGFGSCQRHFLIEPSPGRRSGSFL